MFWRERAVGGETVVRFSGVLDASNARGVERFLRVGPSGKVILDLSQAVDVDYYGLSALLGEIAHSGAAVLLRGLRANHVRMLAYFDLDPARFGLADDRCLNFG
jgi:anti-anti-sigma regulatory factor